MFLPLNRKGIALTNSCYSDGAERKNHRKNLHFCNEKFRHIAVAKGSSSTELKASTLCLKTLRSGESATKQTEEMSDCISRSSRVAACVNLGRSESCKSCNPCIDKTHKTMEPLNIGQCICPGQISTK